MVSKEKAKSLERNPMTKKEIIKLLKEVIKNENLTFKDPTDKKYALDMLKDGDLDLFFQQMDVCEIEDGSLNTIEEMEDEWSAISD